MEVDWTQLREVVLKRLHARYDRMSEALRAMPTIVFQDPETMKTIMASPNEALLEVTNLSDLGKKIIAATMQELRRLQP